MPTGRHKSLKRKVHGVVDQISEDFSDFSLSSPATKIRRLHVDLPPIVEEHEQEEHESLPNDERALVLFKPFLHHSPDYNNSSFSLTLNSDLISQIKSNQVSWSKQCDYSSDYCDPLKIEEREQNDDSDNRRLAIVPWVQQQQHLPSCSHGFDDSEDNDNTNTMELMEADEEGVMMDVEEQDCNNAYNNSTTMFMGSEGFQQHCLLPQIPQNTSTPITWTR